MVSVAKNLDGPIKLLFLKASGTPRQFSMLGLGDIVVPGIFVALMLRMDRSRGFQTSYFASAMAGYVGGLLATVLVMTQFDRAQPALLYLVPGEGQALDTCRCRNAFLTRAFVRRQASWAVSGCTLWLGASCSKFSNGHPSRRIARREATRRRTSGHTTTWSRNSS